MTKEDVSALLGRPLTPIEDTNFDLYLEIAKESLEELLCISLDKQAEGATATERTFDIREGYSTVFVDIFTDATEVKVDGNATTDFYPAFWDKRTNSFYNSILLGDTTGETVVITAKWGFASVPSDLQLLWSQLFANTSKKYAAGSVKSKKVEDFSITYGDLSDDEVFTKANARTIGKYSMCNIGYVMHGRTCLIHRRLNCGNCI